MVDVIKVKRVNFDIGREEYSLHLCKTCWGDEGVSVYKNGYFIGLLDLLIADSKEEPLISMAKKIKKDESLLDEVSA
ncbi:hypothetical protein QI305_12295 [Staphylococcus saprophyticus]|nr:hypothetical protein [Staphylococcus saprophyticus]